jgi:hypothetical protein
MNKTARLSLMTTAILVGTLYAGIWRAEAEVALGGSLNHH